MPALRTSLPLWICLLLVGAGWVQPLHSQSAQETRQTKAALAGIAILPSRTDPEIKTFDFPHTVQVDRDIVIRQDPTKPAPRHQLLVWMTGTGGRSGGANAFCKLAASQGYHVVKLMYPNDVPASFCRQDEDPESFEKFRLCIIEGGTHPKITVSRADSIESRLIKLLQHLKKIRQREGWGEFLNNENKIQWDKLALAGQSQGGGHAILMAMKHPVARVIATGAPKDWSLRLNAPAAWLQGKSATPKSRLFTFNHEPDHQGCAPEQQWAILESLGLTQYGPVTSVDKTKPPYGHSRCLSTNHPGGKIQSSPAHTSVIASSSADLFGPVWQYMLTEPDPMPESSR